MRNQQAPHIDFSSLRGAISSSPNAIPSNIDMIAERRGRFLVGEFKRDGEQMLEGQKILLRQLSELPSFTVLIIDGYSGGGELYINKFGRLKNGKVSVIGGDVTAFTNYYRGWYEGVYSKG